MTVATAIAAIGGVGVNDATGDVGSHDGHDIGVVGNHDIGDVHDATDAS